MCTTETKNAHVNVEFPNSLATFTHGTLKNDTYWVAMQKKRSLQEFKK